MVGRLAPLDRKILRELWRMRSQALAIALVIGAGIAMFVMSSGTLLSLEETRAAYYERNRFADVFAFVRRAPQTLAAKIARLAGVKAVETRIVRDVILDIDGLAEPATGRMISIHDDPESGLNRLYLRAGRWTQPGVGEILIGEAMAEAHGFAPGDRVAAVVNGRKKALAIAGIALSPEYVYALPPGGMMPDDKRFGVMWMPRAELAAAFDLDGAFNDVILTLDRTVDPESVITALDRILAPYGGTGGYARKDQVSNWFVNGELDQLQTMATMVPPIFLAVAAFLLHIVISRLIATEREQIGLLKAFGYGNGEIGSHYLKLVFLIVGFGVFVGFGLGSWLARGMTAMYTDYFRFPFLVFTATPSTYVIAAAIAFAVAVLGTLSAVLRAARLAPAVAMQAGVPTVYRRAWIEGLMAVDWFGETARMVIRHLLRWPVRAALTVLGLSMSVAMLIASMFFLDSMEELIDITFFRSQRYDAALTFVDRRPMAAIAELRALDGVVRAEPYRAVPVRLRHGHRSHREALIGLSRDGQLQAVLDQDLKALSLPRSGLMISSKLAKKLNAGPGTILRVEVLEGHRQILSLPVAAMVEAYMGTPVYMDLDALNRTLNDGRVVSGAYLQIDDARAPALYRTLKNMPKVAAATMRRTMLDSFNKTIEENLGLMIVFNVGFACVITFGVVYNSARISLSERGRELASLRVLGFTLAEVSAILLGELAVLTLLALPLGSVLGYALSWAWSRSLDTELYRIPLVVSDTTFGFAMLVTLGATVISGWVVRRRIDKLDLVAVLKTRE